MEILSHELSVNISTSLANKTGIYNISCQIKNLYNKLPNPRSHHFIPIKYYMNVHSMVDLPTGLWQVSEDADVYPGVHPGTELTE